MLALVLPGLTLILFRILDIWKNKDEALNKEQMHDEEMIKEVKRNEVEEELRRQVDYLMREELDILKIVSRYHHNNFQYREY